jgi:HTH-type transcriptional regulator/antitoxin HigA
MTIKPIKNDEDHQSAKRLIEELLLSEQNQSVQDKIEVLATLIERYERESFIAKAPSAVEAIRFRMSQSGLEPKDLEPYIGKRARVSEVLSGTRSLSIDMIRALHLGLNIPYEALLQKEGPSGAAEIRFKDLSLHLIRKLSGLGVELNAENISSFLKGAFGSSEFKVLNRKTRTQRASGKTDATSLMLWQAVVLSRARQEKPAGTFRKEVIDKDFLRRIAQLSAHPKGPIRAKHELSLHGITLIIVDVLPGTYLDGAIMLLDGERPVIGLTIRHDRIDNFWFTLLHELSHLARHLDVLETGQHVIFDELDLESTDKIEDEADELAMSSLISATHDHVFSNEYASSAELKEISEAEGVHISIIAGRWQRQNNNYKKFSKLIERNTVREMLTAS